MNVLYHLSFQITKISLSIFSSATFWVFFLQFSPIWNFLEISLVVLPSPRKEAILKQSASFQPAALPIVAEKSLNFHACIIELGG